MGFRPASRRDVGWGHPLVLPLALATLLLGACGEDEDATGDGGAGAEAVEEGEPTGQQSFDARLEPLNDSGVTGRVILSRLGSTLRVQATISGLEPSEEHVQHVHRLRSGDAARCPGDEADEDGDGMVDLHEALPTYGPVGLKLEPYPRASRRGEVSYQGTFELPAELEPLTDRVIVTYGMDIDGVYDPTLPVACGEIR